MGIPSYYKRLANSIKGLVVPHRNDTSFQVRTLLFDFNCMIYQVLRSPDVAPFPGYGTVEADAWETALCQRVVDYTVKVWNEVGKPKQVFLGLDGVVPMAKIRQQRLRRFKSIWTAKEDSVRGLRPAGELRWDTNAITPGTAFMEKLGKRLQELCKAHGWTLSDTNEPGEGEQKCMAFWKQHAATTGNVVIYGLDADLIVLCLLTKQLIQSKESVWCIREAAEWEPGNKTGGFMRLSIDKLFDTIRNPALNPLEWTLDYVAAMSFLGNDFVPHGISLKIRDGGYDRMMEDLKQLHASGQRLCYQKGGLYTYTPEGLRFFAQKFAANEEQQLLRCIKQKRAKINYEDWQMSPCEWEEEKRVLCESDHVLHTDWNARMIQSWFGTGVTEEAICNAYAYGLQWVLDYYTAQRPCNALWIYPWSLPPSWASWNRYCAITQGILTEPTDIVPKGIQPQEQLAMVLPLESWQFLRDSTLRKLPDVFPQFWPSKFGFFSAGRTFLWECEAEIPLLHLATVRSLS